MKPSSDTKVFFRSGMVILSFLISAALLGGLLTARTSTRAAKAADLSLIDAFDQEVTNQISGVLEGIAPVKRTYRLSDNDSVAPKPDPSRFGHVETAAQMQDILNQAQPLLDGQKTIFTTETPVLESCGVHYYLDDTILALTWKQALDDCVYTFSEVKVAHPSQFRRFLSENQYNSSILHTTTEMSRSVNAIVASSGDYYSYRRFGIIVNNGQVYRERGHLLDTCYIDENGDLLFTMAGEITDMEAAQAYVKEHNVRFSLCFGPLMILDGEYCVPRKYNSGEINDRYSRAALCQLGPLHYMVVTANNETPYYNLPTVAEFGTHLYEMGVPTAYCLDGGQTAAIAMNHQLINTVSYGAEREISDIIYFATALPEETHSEVSK